MAKKNSVLTNFDYYLWWLIQNKDIHPELIKNEIDSIIQKLNEIEMATGESLGELDYLKSIRNSDYNIALANYCLIAHIELMAESFNIEPTMLSLTSVELTIWLQHEKAIKNISNKIQFLPATSCA